MNESLRVMWLLHDQRRELDNLRYLLRDNPAAVSSLLELQQRWGCVPEEDRRAILAELRVRARRLAGG